MKKMATHPERFLTKSRQLYYELIDRIAATELQQLPMTEEAARASDVNVNTIKSVYSELARDGFIETRRKAGSRAIRTYSSQQMETYRGAKQKVISQLQALDLAGLAPEEMIAALMGALAEYSRGGGQIIYTEKDFFELQIGKQELEVALGTPVTPMYMDDVIEALKANHFRADLIITTFFCESRLRALAPVCPVIPLRITPPLEQLLNFTLIPRETNITLAVISEHIRQRMHKTYPNIAKDFINFRIHTINEILSDPDLIGKTTILLTFKQIYRENEELFQRIPKIITYNRFHDDEGINQIRSLLE